MDDSREQHQAELERGITLQLAPELKRSDTWRMVWMAANREGLSVEALVADGIMAAVEAAEDDLRDQQRFN
jgi:hypothetical protein